MYPITRDVPWVNFLILAAGLAFVVSGFMAVFGRSQEYKGKVAGSILGVLSFAVTGLFLLRHFLCCEANARNRPERQGR